MARFSCNKREQQHPPENHSFRKNKKISIRSMAKMKTCAICRVDIKGHSIRCSGTKRKKELWDLIPRLYRVNSSDANFLCGLCYMSISSALKQAKDENTPGEFVVVLKSKIDGAGKGLFALKGFRKGEHVATYGGLRIEATPEEIRQHGLASTHIRSVSHRQQIVGHVGFSGTVPGSVYGYAAKMNADKELQNVHNVRDTHSGTIVAVATRDIEAGEELLSYYGENHEDFTRADAPAFPWSLSHFLQIEKKRAAADEAGVVFTKSMAAAAVREHMEKKRRRKDCL